jgi:hypothetical protein
MVGAEITQRLLILLALMMGVVLVVLVIHLFVVGILEPVFVHTHNIFKARFIRIALAVHVNGSGGAVFCKNTAALRVGRARGT